MGGRACLSCCSHLLIKAHMACFMLLRSSSHGSLEHYASWHESSLCGHLRILFYEPDSLRCAAGLVSKIERHNCQDGCRNTDRDSGQPRHFQVLSYIMLFFCHNLASSLWPPRSDFTAYLFVLGLISFVILSTIIMGLFSHVLTSLAVFCWREHLPCQFLLIHCTAVYCIPRSVIWCLTLCFSILRQQRVMTPNPVFHTLSVFSHSKVWKTDTNYAVQRSTQAFY